jgi:predicted permease
MPGAVEMGVTMEMLAFAILCVIFGMALRLSGRLPDNASAAFNCVIIYVAAPAAIVIELQRVPIDLGVEIFWAAAAGVLVAVLLLAAILRRSGSSRIARQVLLFPPLHALVLALIVQPIRFPAEIELIFDRLSAVLIPLVCVSLGYQLRPGSLRVRLNGLRGVRRAARPSSDHERA